MPPESLRELTELNIAHVVYFMGQGGLENRIFRLLTAWRDLPVRFHIVSLRVPEFSTEPMQLPPGVEHVQIRSTGGVKIGVLAGLRRFFTTRRIDIVHTHNWVTMLDGLAAAYSAAVPVAVHGEHGSRIFEPDQKSFRRTVAQSLLARLADAIVCVNQPIAEYIQEQWHLPSARTHVIENGVDLRRFNPVREPHSGFVIGTVGRLATVKDFPTLIEAIGLLRDRGCVLPQVHCSIVGSGPEYSNLKSLIERAGLEQFCSLEGGTHRPEDWYARFDAFVNCSVSEGMSNTLLEAMASGLPLICSDIPGHRSWVRPRTNALYFRAGNSAELAECIATLARDSVLAQDIATCNRSRIEKEFSNERFIAQYADFYRDCLNKRGFRFAPFESQAILE